MAATLWFSPYLHRSHQVWQEAALVIRLVSMAAKAAEESPQNALEINSRSAFEYEFSIAYCAPIIILDHGTLSIYCRNLEVLKEIYDSFSIVRVCGHEDGVVHRTEFLNQVSPSSSPG